MVAEIPSTLQITHSINSTLIKLTWPSVFFLNGWRKNSNTEVIISISTKMIFPLYISRHIMTMQCSQSQCSIYAAMCIKTHYDNILNLIAKGRAGPQCVRTWPASPGDGHPAVSPCQEDPEVGRHPHPGCGRGHVLQWLLQGRSSKEMTNFPPLERRPFLGQIFLLSNVTFWNKIKEFNIKNQKQTNPMVISY